MAQVRTAWLRGAFDDQHPLIPLPAYDRILLGQGNRLEFFRTHLSLLGKPVFLKHDVSNLIGKPPQTELAAAFQFLFSEPQPSGVEDDGYDKPYPMIDRREVGRANPGSMLIEYGLDGLTRIRPVSP